MKQSLLILAASAALIGAGRAAAAPIQRSWPGDRSPGRRRSVAAPMESSVPPPVNPDALRPPMGCLRELRHDRCRSISKPSPISRFRRASRIARIGDLRSERGAAVARQSRLRARTAIRRTSAAGFGSPNTEQRHDAEPECRRLDGTASALAFPGLGLSLRHGLERRRHLPHRQAARRGERRRRALHPRPWPSSRAGAGRALAPRPASASARQSAARHLAGAALRASRRLQCRASGGQRRAHSR